MKLNDINTLLAALGKNNREALFDFAHALMAWMDVDQTADQRPKLVNPQSEKLRSNLVPAPQTVQPQLYRLSDDKHSIRIRLAVLKKLKKDWISLLVDSDPGGVTYQAAMRGVVNVPGRDPYVSAYPYFIHFITTPEYDQLLVVVNQGDQKRIVRFKTRLSHTQYNKILPQWKGIGNKSKPEIASILWSSLDIREVNKDFYKQIKESFDAVVGQASTWNIQATDQQVKQFAVRLIGRYIFCWFLKEKNIVPEALLSSETVAAHRETYYQTHLARLYFQTLNEEVQSRKPAEQASELDALYANIPYLNGGLFDRQPEDDLFANVDLNEWLIKFVETLEGFDFTVDESSSQYQQVAIDPEMLGRIFENLLATQNEETAKMANQRKAFGAFYTPREIVDYMVNQSLKAHLETRLLPVHDEPDVPTVAEPSANYTGNLFAGIEPRQSKIDFRSSAAAAEEERRRKRLQEHIDKLFSPECTDNPFDKNHTPAVRQALSDVTILDPACGSGAFPMGVLLRLMELRQIVGHGHKNNYELKSEILSNNIYGVDIMPMAVEIARLRAWLSLVLEADYKPNDRKNNFGIAALPNLDFKFVCANSLIDSGFDDFERKIQHNDQLAVLHQEIRKLEQLRDAYFDPKGDKSKKIQLQKQFVATKNHIKESFSSIRASWNLDDFLSKVDDWNPFDDSHPSSFFSPAWMFGIRDGFDVVIGNPPYVQIQKMDVAKKAVLAAAKFETYESTGDLYQLFYERGVKSLKHRGILSFITSNKWMRTNYGVSTRRFFSENTAPIVVVDFGMALVFETATILTNIFIGRRTRGSGTLPICRVNDDFDDPASLNAYVAANALVIEHPREMAWVAYSREEYELISKIESQGEPLHKWGLKINRGILTGFNEAFIIDQDTREALVAADPRSAEIIRPLLRGEDVKAFWPEFAGQYIIATFPALKLDIEDYPAVKAHLLKYKERIEPKPRNWKGDKWPGRKQGSYKWFETQDSISYHEDFSLPKIIYPNMTKFLPFVYDESGIMTNQKCFILSGSHLKYLTAVFNSALWKFAFKSRFPELLGETYELSKVFFVQIPIKKPVQSYEEELSKLVEQIVSAKKSNLNSANWEMQLNALVFKLYQLNHDEVTLIDPAFGMSKSAYEKLALIN